MAGSISKLGCVWHDKRENRMPKRKKPKSRFSESPEFRVIDPNTPQATWDVEEEDEDEKEDEEEFDDIEPGPETDEEE